MQWVSPERPVFHMHFLCLWFKIRHSFCVPCNTKNYLQIYFSWLFCLPETTRSVCSWEFLSASQVNFPASSSFTPEISRLVSLTRDLCAVSPFPNSENTCSVISNSEVFKTTYCPVGNVNCFVFQNVCLFIPLVGKRDPKMLTICSFPWRHTRLDL